MTLSDIQSLPQIAIAINTTYQGKPRDKDDAWWAVYNGKFETYHLTAHDLARSVRKGYALAAVCKNHWRHQKNFQSAQHIGLDFDTETDACRLTTLAADPFIAQFAALLYTSPSHTEEKPRARAIFFLDQPVTDPKLYRRYVAALLKKYNLADQKAKDPARLFYGAVNCDQMIPNDGLNRLPLAGLDALAAEMLPPGRTESPRLVKLPGTADSQDRAHRWALAIANRTLDELAAAPNGERNDRLNKAAYKLGQLINAGLLSRADIESPLIALAEALEQSAATVYSGLNSGEQISPDWLPDFERPAVQTARNITPGATGSRFAYGLPYTLHKRLINAHLKLKGAINAQHPAALVWAVWQELGSTLPDGESFTAYTFQKATQGGRELSRATVETGLKMLAAWGVCDFCNLPTGNDHVDRYQKSHSTYRFWPLDQQLVNFARHYAYVLREHLFAGVPSDVQPEYGELDEDDLGLLNLARQPLYDQHADQRDRAAGKLDQQTDYLRLAVERITAGHYRAVELPPGPLPNAAAYIKAKHKLDLEKDGGQRENAYRDQFEYGRSRATMTRVRAANQVITVPREKTIPLDQVTDYQRDNGLVLIENEDGTATIRVPSAEKFADLTDEHERAAYDDLCQRQRARRDKRRDRDSQLEAPAPPEHRPDTIPTTYSDHHVLEQFEFTPGAEHVARFNPTTGEVYTPTELWRALAERLKAPANSEGEPMPTFASYSEPAESPVLAEPDQPAIWLNCLQDGDNSAGSRFDTPEPGAKQHQLLNSNEPLNDTAEPPAHVCPCGAPGTRLIAFAGWLCDDCAHEATRASLERLRAYNVRSLVEREAAR